MMDSYEVWWFVDNNPTSGRILITGYYPENHPQISTFTLDIPAAFENLYSLLNDCGWEIVSWSIDFNERYSAWEEKQKEVMHNTIQRMTD